MNSIIPAKDGWVAWSGCGGMESHNMPSDYPVVISGPKNLVPKRFIFQGKEASLSDISPADGLVYGEEGFPELVNPVALTHILMGIYNIPFPVVHHAFLIFEEYQKWLRHCRMVPPPGQLGHDPEWDMGWCPEHDSVKVSHEAGCRIVVKK